MPRKQDPQDEIVAVEIEEVIIVAGSDNPDAGSQIDQPHRSADAGAGEASLLGGGMNRAAGGGRSSDEPYAAAGRARSSRPQARLGDVDEDVVEAVEEHNRDEVKRAHKKGPDESRVRRNKASSGAGRKAGKALLGLGLVAAAGGAAAFLSRKLTENDQPTGPLLSDAPDHVLRGKAKERAVNQDPDKSLVGKTVTIGRPRQELYDRWRDFTRFPEFMKNVREVVKLDEKRSQWTIEAPAGATVNVVTRIVEDKPGETIAWVSEPDSQIETDGRVEFADAPPGRGTYVRLLVRYKPPAGAVGQAVAKLLQREPNVQARRDLRRFKQLVETGEVPVNASPSARKSESPTEARI